MRVIERYSHLNGEEFLLVHRPGLWQEVIDVVESVDAEAYSSRSMAAAFATGFKALGWRHRRAWAPSVSNDVPNQTQGLDVGVRGRVEQADAASPADGQSDFAKDRVAVEIQFGRFPFVLHDLFGSPLALFVMDLIDVGVEVLPVKELEAKMALGGPCFERSRSEIVRSGRSVPAVPLVLLGVAP